MNADTAINKIKAKISEIGTLAAKERFCPEFKKWHRGTSVLLQRIFGREAYQVSDFTTIKFVYQGVHVLGDSLPFENRYRAALKEAEAILISIYQEIEEFGLNPSGPVAPNPICSIETILLRFHAIARQLRVRHSQRESLDIKDEHDVHDLLNALLWLYFRDIRPEEWTPSYGGNASRMDFLLKEEQIVIEVKMTRKGFSDRDVIDQLLVDIARYEEHPDCKTLVCFVYDPDGWIGNSTAVVSDLEKRSIKLSVRVFVQPEII